MNDQSGFNKLPEQAVEKLEEVKKEVASYTERSCSAVVEEEEYPVDLDVEKRGKRGVG